MHLEAERTVRRTCTARRANRRTIRLRTRCTRANGKTPKHTLLHHTHAHAHTHPRTHMHTHAHAHTHTLSHTHIQTHTHTCTSFSSSLSTTSRSYSAATTLHVFLSSTCGSTHAKGAAAAVGNARACKMHVHCTS